jgi:hypothetical protein
MGSLIQLMRLPAAWMLFAWIGRGGADAIVALACQLVAMMARTVVPRTHPVAPRGGAKGVKPVRARALVARRRKSASKESRIARPPGSPRPPGEQNRGKRWLRVMAGLLWTPDIEAPADGHGNEHDVARSV